MLETEKAYIAGLIDGEGHIGIYRESRGCLRPQVRIEMQDKELVEWLHSITGAGGTTRTITRNGYKYHTYAIKWSARKAAALLVEVLPYLRAKRKQAEIFLEFCTLGRGAPEKESVAARLLQTRLDAKIGV